MLKFDCNNAFNTMPRQRILDAKKSRDQQLKRAAGAPAPQGQPTVPGRGRLRVERLYPSGSKGRFPVMEAYVTTLEAIIYRFDHLSMAPLKN